MLCVPWPGASEPALEDSLRWSSFCCSVIFLGLSPSVSSSRFSSSSCPASGSSSSTINGTSKSKADGCMQSTETRKVSRLPGAMVPETGVMVTISEASEEDKSQVKRHSRSCIRLLTTRKRWHTAPTAIFPSNSLSTDIRARCAGGTSTCDSGSGKISSSKSGSGDAWKPDPRMVRECASPATTTIGTTAASGLAASGLKTQRRKMEVCGSMVPLSSSRSSSTGKL
mmetsp:Transcript_15768/g.37279  ORF Transcript_15768/g.37279 Transcript_15768/m.37279 type:complete len:226 (-) Transcript_15768:3971-4648(-)